MDDAQSAARADTAREGRGLGLDASTGKPGASGAHGFHSDKPHNARALEPHSDKPHNAKALEPHSDKPPAIGIVITGSVLLCACIALGSLAIARYDKSVIRNGNNHGRS